MSFLRQTVNCTCGKVKLGIDSPSVLRLVCYCKDCRGYYNTINEMARNEGKEQVAKLDDWGGVDMTQIYPSEIKVVEGMEHLTTCRIREESKQKLVYSTCCYTPMFRIGGESALLNTNLIPDENNKADVRFRIVGRDALKEEQSAAAAASDKKKARPNLSWSIPFSFPFVMFRRVKKDLMTPEPLDTKDARVLENFKQG